MMKSYYTRLKEHPEIYQRDLMLIKKFHPAAKSILEIGFGYGGFLSLAKKQFKQISGIDTNKEAVQLGKKNGYDVYGDDATKMHFKNNSFDVIYAKEILEHVEKPTKMMSEVHRVLNKNGIVVIIVPTHLSLFYPVTNFFDDYTHIRPFTKETLFRLFTETGFEMVTIEGFTSGRNLAEKMLGKILGIVFPHSWRCIGVKI